MDIKLNLSWWEMTILCTVLLTWPVKLAADFVDAQRSTMPMAALSVILGTIASYLAYTSVGGSLDGLFFAFIAMAVVYKIVLQPSISGAFGMVIMAFAIQVAIISAIASFLHSSA